MKKLIGATTVLACACASAIAAEGRRQKGAPSELAQARDLVTSSPGTFKPFFFVHSGDPQMGFGKREKMKEKIEIDKRRFAELARKVNVMRPAFVFLAGDLVHLDVPEAHAALDEVLRSFEVPVKIVPGNHDRPLRDWAKRKKYGDGAYNLVVYNNCAFVSLNSMALAAPMADESTPARERERREAQWVWLERTLKGVRARGCRHIFILKHFPPFVEKEDEKRSYYNLPPKNRARFLGLVRKYGVGTVLAGHVHKNLAIRPDDKAFTIYTVGGTARSANGFGYRIFIVHRAEVEQAYVPLDKPVDRFKIDESP